MELVLPGETLSKVWGLITKEIDQLMERRNESSVDQSTELWSVTTVLKNSYFFNLFVIVYMGLNHINVCFRHILIKIINNFYVQN